jgi:phage tail sheath protein FI
MAFRVSPGVTVTETDLTTIVPAASTTRAGLVGAFQWGPVDKIQLVGTETELARRFGKPTNDNYETYFSGANFLQYGNALLVVRAANTVGNSTVVTNTALNAVVSTVTVSNTILLSAVVKNQEHYRQSVDGTINADVVYVAKYPGSLGNSLKISVCDSANAYTSSFNLAPNAFFDGTTTKILFSVNSNTALASFVCNTSASGNSTHTTARATEFQTGLTVGDLIEVGNSSIGKQLLKIKTIGAPVANVTDANNRTVTLTFENKFNILEDWSSNNITRFWEYYNTVDFAPSTSDYVQKFGNSAAVDTLHIVVSDEDGAFSCIPGSVLEVFPNLSRVREAKSDTGASIYYKNIINDSSSYIWYGNDRAGAVSANATAIVSSSNQKPLSLSFDYGQSGLSESQIEISALSRGWDLFKNQADVDVSLLIAGKARGVNGVVVANYLINLCNERKDCMVFISPEYSDVVNQTNNEIANITQFRNNLTSTSFAVLDCGYKYMYDKHNDVYRWVPLNGDIAGVTARTEFLRDAWWSPAGFNRGGIANVVRLAWNPSEIQRDALYKIDCNPVASFAGQGTILYGDKTLLGKPSAFDRINVRRLFIVLQKAIAITANSFLFEFNDTFTRSQFRNIIEPFLRTIQARRGITDFAVVCDESNNTGEVIDRNEFVGDIYIKPTRSINFIRLNFVAVRTNVDFSEIVGRV